MAPSIFHSMACLNSFFEYSPTPSSVVSGVFFLRLFLELFAVILDFPVGVLLAVGVLSAPFFVGFDIEIVIVSVGLLLLLGTEIIVEAILVALNLPVRGVIALLLVFVVGYLLALEGWLLHLLFVFGGLGSLGWSGRLLSLWVVLGLFRLFIAHRSMGLGSNVKLKYNAPPKHDS